MEKKKEAKQAAKKQAANKSAGAAEKAAPAQKRPSANPPIPPEVMASIAQSLNKIKTELEPYAAHLRPLDRKRLNSMGIKKQGFVQRVYEYVMESPEFLPYYLTVERFREDFKYFIGARGLNDSDKLIGELLSNIIALSSDAGYTNALDYYASVREAAKRRVDGAETIYNDLAVFFKHKKPADGKPTAKKLKRDAGALLQGKSDGVIVIENVKPKLTGGKRKVIDERFEDSAKFRRQLDEVGDAEEGK